MPYKNPEDHKAQRRRYYAANREKICLESKIWREKNPEKFKIQTKKWAKNNPDKVRVSSLKSRHRHKEKQNKYYREQYYPKNREKIAKRNRLPVNRIIRRMRSRIREVLLRQSASKRHRTLELVGCTPAQLRLWLVQQFQLGMTLENYGDWHVDHVRPCASFDLSDPEQQKQCFHYSNLQPLWAKKNLSKGAKWQAKE